MLLITLLRAIKDGGGGRKHARADGLETIKGAKMSAARFVRCQLCNDGESLSLSVPLCHYRGDHAEWKIAFDGVCAARLRAIPIAMPAGGQRSEG